MKFSSKCVRPIKATGECQTTNTPIYASTVSRFIDSGQQYYPRYFNTINQETISTKIASLESAEKGIVFSSGMAAISTTLMALLRPGDHLIVLKEMYGGTIAFVEEKLKLIGINVSYVDTATEFIKDEINEKTTMIMVESPTNPFLSIVDLRALAAVAKAKNIITVIDNTFASPVNQRPIELGIDISIHSGTKFLSGHSDLCCGAVVGQEKYISIIQHHAHHFGGCLNPLDCYLLDRSLKTLDIRVKQQNLNAKKLVGFLNSHEIVGRVYYPGLPEHQRSHIVETQMDAPGSVLSLKFKNNSISITQFLNSLNLVTPGISLGGIETTVCSPYLTSHHKMPEQKRKELGITRDLLRFSIGIEAWDDIANDIFKAIEIARV